MIKKNKETVLVKYKAKWYMDKKYVYAEIIGWDYPLWGILGRRLWLKYAIEWIDMGYTENFIFRRFEWQVTKTKGKYLI